MTTFESTAIDYAAIAPIVVVVAAALLGVLVEAFVPRRSRYGVQLAIAVLGLLGSLAAVVTCARTAQTVTAAGAIVVDGPTLLLQGVLLVMGLLALLIMADRLGGPAPDAFTQTGSAAPGSFGEQLGLRLDATTTEVFPLFSLCMIGMLIFPAAGDLITMFVALEVLSLPLYILTGLARRRRLLSQEASLKYFLLGAFSSAFFLFGAALIYGYAGSVRLSEISAAITAQAGMDGLLLPGAFLLAVGLLFKVGAVPFHVWTPDVYQGAPTPVTGFMAACTKVAAFGALLRLFYVGLAPDRWSWAPALWTVALLTIILGSVLTVTQTDMKRLLGYSSIAHAGFILIGVMAFDRSSVSGVMFYLVAYGFASIAAFGLIWLVREEGAEATAISQWVGLGRRSPWVAAAFTILLASFAGIPLTAGFIAKVSAFAPAVAHGGAVGVGLVIAGVICSAIAAWGYFNVAVKMWFDSNDSTAAAVTPSIGSVVAITLSVALVIALGIIPGPLLDLAGRVAQFLS